LAVGVWQILPDATAIFLLYGEKRQYPNSSIFTVTCPVLFTGKGRESGEREEAVLD
jgi:hypothetical protein